MKKILAIMLVMMFAATFAAAQKCGTCHPFRNVKPCPKVVKIEKKVVIVKHQAKPEPKNLSEEVSGYASVRQAGTKQVVTFTTPILFETNSDKLKTESYDPLKKVAVVLKARPNMQTEVKGYTDSLGDPAYNVVLSEKRANSVRNVLVENGVNEANVTAKGYGAADPIADNKTKEGRAKNRRVELDITNK
ncbi:peptidoglycan-associated (lipo)protein-like outer membrane protein [Elusimicrobium minutum Pei191]|uniref:Peptidoglycan-associated (Lipo)protein-like outer membrane protein n=1 Tax=Elusimicrobium minutum (strain Pei191) TaxID=445932 RepID=B2KCS2_ELUMP|nr:OmpA family protein [Elusimicrobium minutum]ACC98318.1 peptidoglycan-associated (lipo)protein-like outer membrane protein [Elusimicrobium minutum Pei191]